MFVSRNIKRLTAYYFEHCTHIKCKTQFSWPTWNANVQHKKLNFVSLSKCVYPSSMCFFGCAILHFLKSLNQFNRAVQIKTHKPHLCCLLWNAEISGKERLFGVQFYRNLVSLLIPIHSPKLVYVSFVCSYHNHSQCEIVARKQNNVSPFCFVCGQHSFCKLFHSLPRCFLLHLRQP